jgi:lysylphosphatidylglycerol synthetase-like protein (DUF2156 family)
MDLLLPLVFIYRIPFLLMHCAAILRLHAATAQSLHDNTTPLYFLKELTLCVVTIFFTPINNTTWIKYIALIHVATHVVTAVLSLFNQKYLITRGLQAHKETDWTFELGLLFDTLSHALVLAATGYYIVQAGLSVYLVAVMFIIGMAITAFQVHQAQVKESEKDE